MILRTRFVLSSAATPYSALPALLFTTVRSRAPWAIRASISSLGTPTPPKPPISTVAPSKISATAASRLSTVRSIKALSPDCLVKPGSIAATACPVPAAGPANGPDASERRARVVPIEAQSAAMSGDMASIWNDERGRHGVTSGRGWSVHRFLLLVVAAVALQALDLDPRLGS